MHSEQDAAASGRRETPAERADRNFQELLTELRVLQTGVQILFGFLLILAVQPRFADASQFERAVYLLALLLTCAATALLMAPVAYHRALFSLGQKADVVAMSNRLADCGIFVLMLAIGVAVLLVVDFVFDRPLAWLLGTAVIAVFVVLWYLLPLSRRRSSPAADIS